MSDIPPPHRPRTAPDARLNNPLADVGLRRYMGAEMAIAATWEEMMADHLQTRFVKTTLQRMLSQGRNRWKLDVKRDAKRHRWSLLKWAKNNVPEIASILSDANVAQWQADHAPARQEAAPAPTEPEDVDNTSYSDYPPEFDQFDLDWPAEPEDVENTPYSNYPPPTKPEDGATLLNPH